MGKMKSNLNYLTQKINQQEAELETVKKQLVLGGIAESRIQVVFKPRKKDIAEEILNLAQAEKFNIIVINHRPGKVSRFFTGNVFSKVVSAVRNITVCVVT